MNEDQLKLFIQQAFANESFAAAALENADQVLVQALKNVRALVESLPEDQLMRQIMWKDMLPAIARELAPYNEALADSVIRELLDDAPEMAEQAVKMIEAAGVPQVGFGDPTDFNVVPTSQAGGVLTQEMAVARPGLNVPASVERQILNLQIGDKRFAQLFGPGSDGLSEWTYSNNRVVDRIVQQGILKGTSTPDIGKQIVQTFTRANQEYVNFQGETAMRKIRNQARTVARTAVQDMNSSVNREVRAANQEALDFFGFEYEWIAVLDSRTCPFCASLDDLVREKEAQFPRTPTHPNCRCQVIAIDPTDPGVTRSAIEISEKPFPPGPGVYKTKVKVKGKWYHRKAVQITPTKGQTSNYADYLAKMPANAPEKGRLTSQDQFFGGGEKGRSRGKAFRKMLDDGYTPQQALNHLVTGDPARMKNLSKLTPDRVRWDQAAGSVKPKPKLKLKKRAVKTGSAENSVKTATTPPPAVKLKPLPRSKPVSFKDWDSSKPGMNTEYPTLADVYKRQGKQQGKPVRVKNVDELKNMKGLIKDADGENIVIYRGVTGPAQKQQLLGKGPQGGEHFAGKGLYGNGTYGASKSTWDAKRVKDYVGDDYVSSPARAQEIAKLYANETWFETAKHHLAGTGKRYEDVFKELTPAQVNSRVTAFGLRKDAKVKTFTYTKDPQKAVDDWEAWQEEVWKKSEKLGEFDDVGDAAAALGWDGYQVPSPEFEVTEDYWVILNRRAMVTVDGDPF